MPLMLDLIADTRRKAYGSMSDQLNFLAAEAPLGAAELFMVMDLSGITPGMVLSSGLHVYYVVGTVASEKKVLVYPSYDNSKNDALPVGSPVMIRPRATDWLLFNNLNDEITRLSSPQNMLYREGVFVAEPFQNARDVYQIPDSASDMLGILRVRAVDGVHVRAIDPRWYRWVPEAGGIRFLDTSMLRSKIEVVYRAPFKRAEALSSDVIVECGLSDTMTDIPPLGAAAALLRTTESRRSQIHAQGDPRRADEVPSGANASAAREMARDYRSRIDDEYARLVNRNPIKMDI
jgi:hypothetical protein